MYRRIVIALIATVSFVPSLASAQSWTAPTQTPPNGNVSSPLNAGGTAQSKVGGLLLNTGGATNGLIVQYGKVGIDTVTPGKTLDVQGGASFGSSTYQSGAIVDIGSASTDYPGNSGWASSWNSNLLLSGLDTTSITFHDSGTSVGALGHVGNYFFFDGAGSWGPISLGINTRTPSQALEVVGYVKGTGLCIGTDCRTSWPATGVGTVTGSGTANYVPKWFSASALGNSIIYDNGSTVGIGVANDVQKLAVAGNIHVMSSSGTSLGYVYSDGSNYGLLNNQGNWAVYTPNNTQNAYVPGYLVAGELQSSDNLYLGYLGDWISNRLGQDVRNGASPTFDDPYVNNWVRVNGGGGIYWQAYGGGWYMSDTTWLRSYNNKNVYTAGQIRGDGGLCIGTDCRTSWPATGLTSESDTIDSVLARGNVTYRVPQFQAGVDLGNGDSSGGASDTAGIKSWNSISLYTSCSSCGYNSASNWGIQLQPRNGSATFKGDVTVDSGGILYLKNPLKFTGGGYNAIANRDGGFNFIGKDGDSNFNFYSATDPLTGQGGGHTSGVNMWVAGPVTANSYHTNSDRNLKKNIVPLEDALSKVLKLQGVSFNWKNDNRSDIGVIAQDVEKVFPQLVETNKKSGTKTVEYGNLVAPLIEAIKEQQKQIDALKAEIQLLKK